MDARARMTGSEPQRHMLHHSGSTPLSTIRWKNMNVVDQTAPMLVDAAKGTQEAYRLIGRLLCDKYYLLRSRISEPAMPKRRPIGFDWAI
jgi:hypothetical protein